MNAEDCHVDMIDVKPSKEELIVNPSRNDVMERDSTDSDSGHVSFEDNEVRNDEEDDIIKEGNDKSGTYVEGMELAMIEVKPSIEPIIVNPLMNDAMERDSNDSDSGNVSFEDNEDRNDEVSGIIKEGNDTSATPVEGMEFDSIEHGWNFYCHYADSKGFKVRKDWESRSRRDKSIVLQKHFYCSKAGWRRKNNKKSPKVRRDFTREGCMARMCIKKTDLGRYRLSKFIGMHNHSLVSPNKKVMLGDCSNKSESKTRIIAEIDRLNVASLKPRQIDNAVARKYDGATNAGSTEKQVVEYIQRGRLNGTGINTNHVLEFFTSMHSSDPGSYYAIEFGDNGCLNNIFWVDSRSRAAYVDFGDVVTFDITYKKNRYQVPLAPFTGLNHHGQSILFGCALISDETESTFTWVFKTWLHAMFDRQPQSIITDQDEAVGLAISKVLPQTQHRLCKWHIRRKLRDKVAGDVQEFNTFETEFDDCINNSESIDSFEQRWKSMIERYGLGGGHAWLESLYYEREKWVSIFLKNSFFAGMSTTQHNKSINSLFQGYMDQNSLLSEFIKQYEKVMDKRYKDEIEQDYYTKHYNRDITTNTAMEKQAACIYTKNIFKKFQTQLLDALDCVIDKVDDIGTTKTFRVKKFEHLKTRTVILNVSDTMATCSCMMFQYKGIPCRHLLAVFRANNILTLPHQFILRRWTRAAQNKEGVPYLSKAQIYGTSDESAKARYNDIFIQALKFAKHGAESPEAYRVIKPILDRIEQDTAGELDKRKLNDTHNTEPAVRMFESAQRLTIHSQSIPTVTQESQTGPNVILESESKALIDADLQHPTPITTEGSPKTHGRFKPRWEDPPKKRRRCTYCKELGHYCSTCPKRSLSDKDRYNVDLTEGNRKDGAYTAFNLRLDSQN